MKKNIYNLRLFTSAMFIAALSILGVHAQILHNVTVANNFFDPDDLTINVGDTVRFTNVEGFHNVNGTTPDNPESFGNSVGEGWVYDFVFTIPGDYAYHCDPHLSQNMVGSITVNAVPTSVQDLYVDYSVRLYPNPADREIIIDLGMLPSLEEKSLKVHSMKGMLLKEFRGIDSEKIRLDVSSYPAGIYLYQINLDSDIIKSGKFLVK